MKKVDAIILVTTCDGQYGITKACIDSIQSKKYKIKTYILHYGEEEWKDLIKRVDHFKKFPLKTQITIEMNYGIGKGLEESDIIFNLNNDVVLHSQTIDIMISLMKEKALSSLSGHIITDRDELKYYSIKNNYDLYFKGNFVSKNKFKTWLKILIEDYGFDLYSMNAWSREYFERVGLPDDKTFDEGIYLWDTDFQYRGALAGIDTLVASSAIYFHECGYTAKHTDNLSAKDIMYRNMKDAYYKKWGGIQSSLRYKGSQHNEDFILPFQNTLNPQEVLSKLRKPML